MRSWVEVSLGQIRANFRAVRALVGESVEVMPVVKADAYRHGAVAVSHALEAEGAHAGWQYRTSKKVLYCGRRERNRASW